MGRRIFSRIFSPDFFSSFLWEKVPRKILQENPRKNPPKFIQQKSSDTFLQNGRGKNKHRESFAILSLQVSRDMKSIVAGPLRLSGVCKWNSSGKKIEAININIWAGRCPDEQEPSPGTNKTPPRTNWHPSLGQNRPFSVEFHNKIAILSRLSLGRVAVRP